jgi:hypothetical protein
MAVAIEGNGIFHHEECSDPKICIHLKGEAVKGFSLIRKSKQL